MDDDDVRIFSTILEDAREAHRAALILADATLIGHVAAQNDGEEQMYAGKDADCIKCGHINEAEYILAVGW